MAEFGEANLVEVFWSAQGEGPQIGRSTIFVRFGGCDLRCQWCDSPGTWNPAATCRFEERAGSAKFSESSNPIDLPTLSSAVDRLNPQAGSLLSLTGGEPLLQPAGLAMAASLGRARKMQIFLETHGLAVEALESVIDEIDYVSMDWKLPGDVRYADEKERSAEAEPFAARHAEFLAVACQRAEVSVKVVVTRNTTMSDLASVASQVDSIAPDTPLILQPVTPFGRVKESPEAEVLLEYLRGCERIVNDVRLIPQTHKFYGAL